MNPGEMPYQKLASQVLADYQPSYRTVLINTDPQLSPQSLRFFHDQGHSGGLNELLNSPDLYTSWILQDFLAFAESLGRPYAMINGDTDLLTRIPLAEAERQRLARTGVNLFFYEPLFLCDSLGRWPWIPGDGPFFLPELEWVEQFRRRLLPNTPVYVHLCNPGLGRLVRGSGQYPQLTFRYLNTHLLHCIHMLRSQVWPHRPLRHFERPLLSLNFRYEPIRELLVGYLRGSGLMQQAYVSYYHRHDEDYFLKRLPFDPRHLSRWPVIEAGIKLMQPELPYSLDVQQPLAKDPQNESIPDLDLVHNQKDFAKIRNFYEQSLINLVTESRPFEPCGEVSEKTLHAIVTRRPFILLGAPGLLASLRDQGFQSFSSLWNEDYDLEPDPLIRTEKIISLLHHLLHLKPAELQQLADRAEPIVQHNFFHLFHRFRQEHLRLAYVQEVPPCKN